eukprot:gnl/MRDRNA2_/MRDRNA2_103981_c0_seq1.p1 gnl/MRDRNA2_/MRDRNA2_103981_c0~~gnl/MRDRNA2_/MRDRNA2_103981_c0_seq1.p1  ORF type:complete len:523 (+),score=112.46 gnl/MRDRNA2_/MRDRNA2_103981_c0_seq1:95-1663(+)
MAEPTVGENEEELGRWPATYKKKPGWLILTDVHLKHISSSQGVEGRPTLNLKLDDIEKYKFSQRSSTPHAAIRMTMHTGEAMNVAFSDEDKWTHLHQFSQWTETRTRLQAELTEERRRLQEGQQLLKELPDLNAAYCFLVKQEQVLTHVEFFESHAAEIDAIKGIPRAVQADLPEIKPPLSAEDQENMIRRQGKVHSEQPPDSVIQHIFREHPNVERLYNATVPASVSVDKFWDRFFKSRFYLEYEGQTVPADHRGDSLFDGLQREAPVDIEEVQKSVRRAEVSDVDLSAEMPKEEAGSREPSTLIQRLNRRSTEIVQSLKAYTPDTDILGDVMRRRQLLQEEARGGSRESLDLPEPPAKVARLNITVDLPNRVSQPRGMQSSGSQNSTSEAIGTWRAHPVAMTVDHKATGWVLETCVNEIQEARRVRKAATEESSGSRDVQDAQAAIRHSRELLRHLWDSHRHEQAKRQRLVKALQSQLVKFQEWQLEKREGRISRKARAAHSLIPPIQHALHVFQKIHAG